MDLCQECKDLLEYFKAKGITPQEAIKIMLPLSYIIMQIEGGAKNVSVPNSIKNT